MTTLGGGATFRCFSIDHADFSSVQWLVNDTELENFNITGVKESFRTGSYYGILEFSEIPLQYNETSVQCRATLSSGNNIPESSEPSQLLLQGTGFTCACC